MNQPKFTEKLKEAAREQGLNVAVIATCLGIAAFVTYKIHTAVDPLVKKPAEIKKPSNTPKMPSAISDEAILEDLEMLHQGFDNEGEIFIGPEDEYNTPIRPADDFPPEMIEIDPFDADIPSGLEWQDVDPEGLQNSFPRIDRD